MEAQPQPASEAASTSNGGHDDDVKPACANEDLLWRPANVDDHNLTKLRNQINAEHGIDLKVGSYL